MPIQKLSVSLISTLSVPDNAAGPGHQHLMVQSKLGNTRNKSDQVIKHGVYACMQTIPLLPACQHLNKFPHTNHCTPTNIYIYVYIYSYIYIHIYVYIYISIYIYILRKNISHFSLKKTKTKTIQNITWAISILGKLQ